MLPPDPLGSLPVTETMKLVDVVAWGRGLTLLVGGVTSTASAAENSEVLPIALVAVAVITSPGLVATERLATKLAVPEPSVVKEASQVCRPSP